MTDELAKARLKRQRQLLIDAEVWTPRQALEAALADMDLGELQNVEAISVVVATHLVVDGERQTHVERYTGSNGATGPKETFWIIGLLQVAISQWLR